MRATTFACCLWLVTATSAWSHPFHASQAELEWNADSDRLEIALRMDPLDLQQALRSTAKRPVVLETEEDLDQLLRDYVNAHFFFATADGQKAALHWVGHELEVNAAWLYFEVALDEWPADISMTNTLLFETVDDQVNFVMLRGKQPRTLHFTARQPRQRLFAGELPDALQTRDPN